MLQEQKKLLRHRILQQSKQKQTGTLLVESSSEVIKLIQELPEWDLAQHILLYSPLSSELNLLELLSLFPERHFFFPRIEGKELTLYEWFSDAPWIVNTHGIPEPDPKQWRQGTVEEIDLALIPGLAFDSEGGRLGWGRGYFDRLLATPAWRATNIGIAWPWQLVPVVPREEHDIMMDFVITPTHVY